MSLNITLIKDSAAQYEQSLDYLEQQLLISLRSKLTQSENCSFSLIAKSERNQAIGGLSACTSYGWLLIKILWVEEQYRKQGLGKQLLADAESYAATIDCHSVWLDTSNPVAQKFYTKNGYSEFGRLENTSQQNPPEHQRWFMKKTL